MALKVYVVNGATFQYEEGNQPDGAEEHAAPVASTKRGPAPKNKQVLPESNK